MVITKQEKTRREIGMSKAELSRRADVQPNIIGWIEARRFRPYPAQLERIANVLGVDDPSSLLDECEVQ